MEYMNQTTPRKLGITETVLRDAQQSLIATRMPTEQMLPILDTMDQVGYHSVECWGGATFDASLRFLKEDPWKRLRLLRDGFKKTKLQMLLRGQNMICAIWKLPSRPQKKKAATYSLRCLTP